MSALGFPIPGPGVTLLMKPTFDQSDDGWKEEAYARLRELGTVVASLIDHSGLFENVDEKPTRWMIRLGLFLSFSYIGIVHI